MRPPPPPLQDVRRGVVLAALVLCCLACHRAPSRPAAAAAHGPWNVVVLMVDTLRADRLGLYGYSRPTSPRLAERAADAVVMRDARTPAGCTYPSVSSFLTSRWPQHFVNRQDTWGMAIPDDTPSLAEILAAHGYSTAAVSTSVVVRATPSNVNPRGGYGRGFGSFDESCREQSAECVNTRARELLGRLPRPFFLYLHYLDPHQPYQPPADHPRRLATDLHGGRWARQGDTRRVVRRLYNLPQRRAVDPQDAATLSDLYDEEIAYLDARLGELLSRLEDDGRMRDTLVVLLADHGEELLDHGEWGHCRDLAYETVLRTPLLFWIPGGPRGIERSGLVGNLDVVPTVLDLVGIPYRAADFAGTTLRPLIEGGPSPQTVAFGMQGTSRVATDGRYKVWLDLAGGAPRVFDLARGEGSPVTEFDRPAVNRLAAALRAWIGREEGDARGGNLRRARENEAQLKALGYL